MNNFQKFLSKKPADFITTQDIAKKYNISIGKAQRFAKMLNVHKDGAGIYVFDKKAIARFEKLIEVISS